MLSPRREQRTATPTAQGFVWLLRTVIKASISGMRRGEILALKWSDLNFKTGELHIERQVYIIRAEIIISTPKTKASVRTVILPPSLLKTLAVY